jgi:hypothetical protein
MTVRCRRRRCRGRTILRRNAAEPTTTTAWIASRASPVTTPRPTPTARIGHSTHRRHPPPVSWKRSIRRLSPTNRRASSGLYNVSPRRSARCIRRFLALSALFHSADHSGCARRSACTSRRYRTTGIVAKRSITRMVTAHAMLTGYSQLPLATNGPGFAAVRPGARSSHSTASALDANEPPEGGTSMKLRCSTMSMNVLPPFVGIT